MALFEAGSVYLDPTPGFVIKTRVVQGKHPFSTKVFINVCHDPEVPRPSVDFSPEVVFPLIVRNEWEIPLIVSLEKETSDKKGVPSLVYDCCINPECFQWVQVNADLRLILIEWCLELVEMMHEMVLEREFTVPKMLSKGELSKTEISTEELRTGFQKKLHDLKQDEMLGLLEELEPEQDDEELPDLMDIGKVRQKPLIQEISAMTISERIEEVKPTRDAMDTLEPSMSPTPYVYSITPQTRDSSFFVKFESAQITQGLRLSYNQENQTAVLTNTDPSRSLGESNKLEIPLPKNTKPSRSFSVPKEQALYVFCDVHDQTL